MEKQWTAGEVLDTARAFQPACVLAAAADLDVFTSLEDRPMTALSLAAELGTDPRATAILADALTAMQLLAKQNNIYSVRPEVAGLLTEKGPHSILPGLRHLANCLHRWVQLGGVVLTGRPAERSPSILGEAADEAAFIGAMDNFSAPAAAGIIDLLRPLTFNHLLDIGGGSGTWTIAFLLAAPDAKATLFDLPSVIPLARRRIGAAGIGERVRLAAGDYEVDDLPKGADFALLSAIAHQNSRRQNRALFAKIHAALDERGVLVLRDVVMDPSRTEPALGALFAVNMLVATEGGGTYTLDEFREDLTDAGFGRVTLVHRDEGMNSLIRAEKPGG
jgi:predicted O-methyltransferase YrrM